MNTQRVYMLNSSGRQIFPFPWESRGAPCPWDNEKYLRVMIPLSYRESINSHKKVHTQIVRRDKITELRQPRLKLSNATEVVTVD